MRIETCPVTMFERGQHQPLLDAELQNLATVLRDRIKVVVRERIGELRQYVLCRSSLVLSHQLWSEDSPDFGRLKMPLPERIDEKGNIVIVQNIRNALQACAQGTSWIERAPQGQRLDCSSTGSKIGDGLVHDGVTPLESST